MNVKLVIVMPRLFVMSKRPPPLGATRKEKLLMSMSMHVVPVGHVAGSRRIMEGSTGAALARAVPAPARIRKAPTRSFLAIMSAHPPWNRFTLREQVEGQQSESTPTPITFVYNRIEEPNGPERKLCHNCCKSFRLLSNYTQPLRRWIQISSGSISIPWEPTAEWLNQKRRDCITFWVASKGSATAISRRELRYA